MQSVLALLGGILLVGGTLFTSTTFMAVQATGSMSIIVADIEPLWFIE